MRALCFLSPVVFFLARLLSWPADRLYRFGIWARDTQFQPGRFVCHYCRQPARGLIARKVYRSDYSPGAARICRQCDRDIPF